MFYYRHLYNSVLFLFTPLYSGFQEALVIWFVITTLLFYFLYEICLLIVNLKLFTFNQNTVWYV